MLTILDGDSVEWEYPYDSLYYESTTLADDITYSVTITCGCQSIEILPVDLLPDEYFIGTVVTADFIISTTPVICDFTIT